MMQNLLEIRFALEDITASKPDAAPMIVEACRAAAFAADITGRATARNAAVAGLSTLLVELKRHVPGDDLVRVALAVSELAAAVGAWPAAEIDWAGWRHSFLDLAARLVAMGAGR